MIPIYFIYIAKRFTQLFAIATLGFIFILFTLKLDDVARFATFGAPLKFIALFAAYQIPFLLQIVFPLAALLAAFFTMQNLSQKNEITAFRVQGFSFGRLLLPFAVCGVFLSIANFWIVSDISVNAHRLMSRLKSDIQSINPLHLLNNQHLMSMKGHYFTHLGPSKSGLFAEDVFLAIPQQNQRMHLLISKRIDVGQNLIALTFPQLITTTQDDALLLESSAHSTSLLPDLHKLLTDRIRTPKIDQMPFRQLLASLHADRIAHKNPFTQKDTSSKYAEFVRRISASLSPFVFSILGASLGMYVGRSKQIWRGVAAATTAGIYLCFYFFAKSVAAIFPLVLFFYLFPLFAMLALSCFTISRLNKGGA